MRVRPLNLQVEMLEPCVPAAFDNFVRIGLRYTKIRCHRTGQFKVHRVVGFADIKLQPVGVQHRIHVVGTGQAPGRQQEREKRVETDIKLTDFLTAIRIPYEDAMR